MKDAELLTAAQIVRRIEALQRRADKLERERKLRWRELLNENYKRRRAERRANLTKAA